MGFTDLFCSMSVFVALLKDDVFLTCPLIYFVSLLALASRKIFQEVKECAKKGNFRGTI